MDCPKCHVRVLEFKDLFFYIKDEKTISLSVKPELKEIIIKNRKILEERESKKKVRIKCGECTVNLGCTLPFGPQGTSFVAFACDKVKLNGKRFTGKNARWRIVYREFKEVETRDSSTFFNVFHVEEAVEPKSFSDIKQDIVFPSLSNLQHFEWFSVSLVKKPRSYQIEAFIEVLQRNLVVVLKTGSGKTLIASMFLARMCNLNPEKMGLMIVDRIPLVFQQGDAIHADTNLRVAKICGENKTAYKIKQINDKRFDILVVTAGAFYEMVQQRKMIDVNLFCAVVFDECHHMTGGHRYVDVLQLFTKKDVMYQPRILGLTASPVNGKTLIQCQNRLEEFLKSFPNVKIFSPRLPTSDQKIETITMSKTPAQKDFISRVFTEFINYCDGIGKLVKIKDIEPLQMTLFNAHYVLGDLRSIDSEYSEKIKNLEPLVQEAKLLLETMVITDIMGTEYGVKVLESEDKFSWMCKGLRKGISNRLQQLISTIRDMKKESKVLVFVKTRDICTILTKRLQEEFPELHPDRVVGHGGFDGMDWEFDQKGKLEKFSTGKCNVLVCTSVLEEGLDVATCDLVVCFTGVLSLIKFIQAKGRARKQGSHFYVYNSEETVNTNRDFQLQEQIMLAVMKQKESSCALFSELSKDIMRKIQAEMAKDDQVSSLKEKQFSILGDGLDSDFSFVLYCDPVKGVNPNEIKRKVLEDLQECEEFVVNRLILLSDENRKTYSLPRRVFSEEACIFLVSVKCPSTKTPRDTYSAFCNVFPYLIQLDRLTKLPLWSKAKFPIQPLNGNGEVICANFQIGYFTDKKTFVKKAECDQTVVVKFESKDIKFSYEDYDSESFRHVIIPLTSLENFVLLSSTPSLVSLAIPLKHPPFMKMDFLPLEEPIRASILCADPIMTAFSEYPILILNIDYFDLSTVINLLDNQCPVPYYNVNLNIKDGSSMSQQADNFSVIPGLDDALWSLQCLSDSRSFCFPADIHKHTVNVMISKKDNRDDRYLIDKVVQRSCLNHNLPYFYGFDRNLNETYNAFAAVPQNRRHFLEDVVPKHHNLIKRAFVTPLRIVHLPPVPVASNRLLRLLVNTNYSLIIVTFRDEDFSKLQDIRILDRFKEIVANGVTLNGKQYHFLCSTGSQLREHKGYYIAAPSYLEVLEIRKMIIPDPQQFTLVAKYFSRLGLYGTADKPICNINLNRSCRMIDDIMARDGQLLTDGAGKVSATMARQLAEGLSDDLKEIPSAFQIRYSGFKGIVVITSDDDPELDGKSFAFRPSMKKFQNTDESFCVCSHSRLLDLSLNREIITLLCSIPMYWELNTTLLNYQEAAIARYSNMFNEQSIAFKELRNFLPTRDVDQIQDSKMELIDEKYWISILQGIYRLRTREIRTRTNIPLDIQTQGCLIMGVPDPYGVLEEGEVFVQLRKEKCINRVLECPLLVFRNPCLHPGDCPTVKAVFKKELKHLYNVIVFPVKGSQSLPASCSGGDLDGDNYAVVWDPNLIPPAGSGHTPCDYSDLTRLNEPLEPDDVTSQTTLGIFFQKFMSNDCLGRVATKHLSICDHLEKGARDPLAITLSKAQSQAVDFPKTGILPEWPKKLLFEYKEFPDFMEKSLEASYQSKKILGDLYRRCRSLVYNFEDTNSTGRPNVLLNMNLWVQKHEDFLEDAANVYVSYAYDMDMLMRKFELQVEADVILGQATFGWSQHLEADKGKAANAIGTTYKAIVEKYRTIFFSGVSTEDEKRMKASAWYRIVNDPEIKIIERKTDAPQFLSFPWVISDVLCEIRRESERPQLSRRLVNIGETALQLFKKNSPQLCRTIIEKIRKAQDIERSVNGFMKKVYGINKNVFLIEAYGSTSMYLCETDSDIDVCILPKKLHKLLAIKSLFPEPEEFKMLKQREQNKFFLGNIISRAVDTVTSSKKDILEAKVPIIKCSFQDGDKEILCDISMNEVGYRKTLYIHYLYQTDPTMLPMFWILVRWARLSGLIRSTISSDKRMDSAEFYALIIHTLQLPKMEEMLLTKTTRWSGIKFLNQQLDQLNLENLYQLGKLIFEFFRIVSTLDADNMKLYWPAPGIPSVTLDKSKVDDVKKLAAMAYHALSATRDVNTLLNYFLVTSKKNTSIRKTLPLNVSYAIGKARSFHAARLSEISGALVTLEVKEGKDNLELRAEGNRMSIENLLNELKTLVSNNKALVLGRLPQKSSRYFMEGSSIFLVRCNTDRAAILKFENSFGAFELHHNAHQRSAVHVTTTNCDVDEWKEDCVESLANHLLQQFQKFPTGEGVRATELLNGLEVTVRFGCFYLVDIEAHLPDSQRSIQIQELQFSVEKGRRSRKAWSRGEFRANDNLFSQPATHTPTPSFQMVSIKPGRGRDVEEDERAKIKRSIVKNRRTKRGIAAAFTPGVLKSNTTDESARQTALECYRQLVNKCSFRPGQCTKRSPPPFWRVSVNPSTSYEAQINYDRDFNVIKVTERPLNWVHGTILDGRKQEFAENLRSNPDVRILISTEERIQEGSALYRSVFPGGENPIVIRNGKPSIPQFVLSGTQKLKKNFVSMVRNVQHTELYTNGTCDACIVYGIIYFGKDLTITRPFCELSLYFDPRRLTDCIKGDLNGEILESYVENLFTTSNELKEKLDVLLSMR